MDFQLLISRNLYFSNMYSTLKLDLELILKIFFLKILKNVMI